MKSFSHHKVRELRKKRGLTQDQLARRAGLTNNGLIQVECGRRAPKASTLAALADALKVKTDVFFVDEAV